MFEGFDIDWVELPEATLRVRHGGSGPAGASAAWAPPHPRALGIVWHRC